MGRADNRPWPSRAYDWKAVIDAANTTDPRLARIASCFVKGEPNDRQDAAAAGAGEPGLCGRRGSVERDGVRLSHSGLGLSGGVDPSVQGLCRTATAGKPAVGERSLKLCDCTAATPCPNGRIGSEPRCSVPSLVGDYSFEPWWVSCSHWGMYPWPNVVGVFV